MVSYHLNNPKYYIVLSLFSLATYGRLRYSSPCPNCAAVFDNDVTKFLHRSGARNGGHGALHPHAHAPVLPCCLDSIVNEYLLEAISYLPSCAPLYLLLPPCAVSLKRSVPRMRPPISSVSPDQLCVST